MEKHAKLSPSSAHRWLSCTGSLAIRPLYEVDSPYAQEGTRLHEICAKILLGELSLEEGLIQAGDEGDAKKIVEAYVSYVSQYTPFEEGARGVEQKVEIFDDCWGTCDYWVLESVEKTGKIGFTLHIFDLKTGFGVVEAENNKQLLLYSMGVVKYVEERYAAHIYGVDVAVVAHIIQPVVGTPTSTTFTRAHRWEVQARLTTIRYEMKKGIYQYTPSLSNCKYCPHSLTCRSAVQDDQELQEVAQTLETVQFNPHTLGELRERGEFLELVGKNMKNAVYDLALRGQAVENYSLTKGRAMKRWLVEDEFLLEDLRKLSIDPSELTTTEVKSPAQILAITGLTKEDKAKVKTMYKEVLSAPSLKRTTGKTSDNSANSAEEVFKEYI